MSSMFVERIVLAFWQVGDRVARMGRDSGKTGYKSASPGGKEEVHACPLSVVGSFPSQGTLVGPKQGHYSKSIRWFVILSTHPKSSFMQIGILN